jgi:PKD repeat protein
VTLTSCGGKSTKTILNDQIKPCVRFESKMVATTTNSVTFEYFPTYNIGSDIKTVYYLYKTYSPLLRSPSDFHYAYTFERELTSYTVDNIICEASNDAGGIGVFAPPVTVNPIPPVIGFNSNKSVIITNNPIQFTSTNTGGTVNNWYWDFGDGTTSTEQNPVHIYKKPGIYSVMLKGTGPEFSDIETKNSFITVKPDITPILQLLLD